MTGSYISPVFYKQGDVSQYNGRFVTITESDKIVATFNIRIEGTLDYNFEKNGTPLIEMRSQIDPYRRYDQEDDDDEYGSSYEEYNGYNGWDDDTINDAFEGDPEATWNVD